MPNLLFDGQFYPIDLGVRAGQPTEPYRTMLSWLYVTRVTARARNWLTKNPEATPTILQSEVNRIAAEFEFTAVEEPDAVETEAIEIAEEHIRAKLAAQGFPAPKSLRDHALQIASEPFIIDEAKRRVIARAQAAQEILAGV